MAAGKSEAHGPQTGGCDEVPRVLGQVVLGRPHLVLTHLGGDYRLTLG